MVSNGMVGRLNNTPKLIPQMETSALFAEGYFVIWNEEFKKDLHFKRKMWNDKGKLLTEEHWYEQKTGGSFIQAFTGGYLICMAYELLISMQDKEPTQMPRTQRIAGEYPIHRNRDSHTGLRVERLEIWKENQDQNPVNIEVREKTKVRNRIAEKRKRLLVKTRKHLYCFFSI